MTRHRFDDLRGAHQITPVNHDQARAHRARQVLAAYALHEPDPEQWLADMLDALGLRSDS